jgi:hypothetical protein
VIRFACGNQDPFHLHEQKSILSLMTKLLEKALEAVRALSPDEQDSIARVVLQLAGDDDSSPVTLLPEERAAIAKSNAAASRGEFATNDQVRAIWAKHGL